MKRVVKKWGNSAAVRIPAAVLKAIPLETNDVGAIGGTEPRCDVAAPRLQIIR